MKRKQFEVKGIISSELAEKEFFDCPHCLHRNGLIVPVIKPENMGHDYQERFNGNKAMYPEETFAFSLNLTCQKCKGTVAMVGQAVNKSHILGGSMEYVPVLYPKYFYPHLRIIDFPPTGSDLTFALLSSMELFWADHYACANKIRISAELFLDQIGVKGSDKMLGNRIKILRESANEADLELAKRMDAIKFLGNEGSHRPTKMISKHDLLDAYEIMEHLLKKYSDEEKFREMRLDSKTKSLEKFDRERTKANKPS